MSIPLTFSRPWQNCLHTYQAFPSASDPLHISAYLISKMYLAWKLEILLKWKLEHETGSSSTHGGDKAEHGSEYVSEDNFQTCGDCVAKNGDLVEANIFII